MTRTEDKRLRAFAATLRGSGLDMRARELEEMLPRRTRRPASPPRAPGKSKGVVISDEAQRMRVFQRDGFGCCRCASPFSLEMDHFLGRARDKRDEACWTLCRVCHRTGVAFNKTENKPSRRYWLDQFREHAEAHGFTEMVAKVDALIAKNNGKHNGAALRAPRSGT